ncbi:MAG: DUF3343 domain-containing protein [Thermovenabulum sp.]|uniref:DUF3343 domain-containing protein n=1 Tax=Thermovenabulum sp. TaxID=3100335 RepID=UPI003C7C0C3B
MAEKYPFYLITFPSVHHALKFENNFKGKLPFELVPVPREISSSCGVAAKILETENILDISFESIDYEEIFLFKGPKNFSIVKMK